jgi:hypothetical protein
MMFGVHMRSRDKAAGGKAAAAGRRRRPGISDLVRAGETVLQGLVAAAWSGARSAAPLRLMS